MASTYWRGIRGNCLSIRDCAFVWCFFPFSLGGLRRRGRKEGGLNYDEFEVFSMRNMIIFEINESCGAVVCLFGFFRILFFRHCFYGGERNWNLSVAE